MSFKCPEFKFVTVGCLQEWKASNSNFKLPEPVSMIRFLYELCWAMIRGELPFQKCKLALDSATFLDGKKEEIGSMLVDIIAHLGQDLTIPAEYRNCLTKMEKWFAESSLVPTRLLQERCEEEFLWESELSKLKANDLKSKEHCRQCIHPQIPQMAILGYSENISNIHISEMRARWLACFLDNGFLLPNRMDTEKNIIEWDKYFKRYTGGSSEYYRRCSITLIRNWYNDQLCKDMGCNPRMKNGFLAVLFLPYDPTDYAQLELKKY